MSYTIEKCAHPSGCVEPAEYVDIHGCGACGSHDMVAEGGPDGDLIVTAIDHDAGVITFGVRD